MNKLPDSISFTTTAFDAKFAKKYLDLDGCLIATALKRRGYSVSSVGPNRATLLGPNNTGALYDFSGVFGPTELGYSRQTGNTTKRSIGIKFVLTKRPKFNF